MNLFYTFLRPNANKPHTVWAVCLLLGMLAFSFTASAQTITGTVFRDFNADGAYTAVPASGTYAYGEPGVGGVRVTAYGSTGPVAATTTSSTAIASLGTYTLTVGAATGPFRLEFTNLPTGDFDGATSTAGNTSVQFVAAASTANFGVNYPADFCQTNPKLATPCYVNGSRAIADVSGRDALVTLPYGNNQTPTQIGDVNALGATWGLAYHRASGKLFSASFGKRHSDWGSLGPDGLYVTNATQTATANTATSAFVNLKTVNPAFDAGTVTRNLGSGNANQANYDQSIFPLIGKIGLGDIDISEDGRYLYVVNLNDRKLWRVEVGPTGVAPTAAAQIVAYTNTPTSPCATGTFRPFAVKTYRGDIYIGGICDGSTGSTRTRSALSATIYKVSQTATPGSAAFTQVWTGPITYNRKANLNNGEGNGGENVVYQDLSTPGGETGISNTSWHPWVTDFAELIVLNSTRPMHPQPMFTDIEFDVDGSMILGFADRTGHQSGNQNWGTNTSSTQTYYATATGDILRLGANANGTFTLESAGASNGNTGSTNNTDGPGGGEYYFQDRYNGGSGFGASAEPSNHDETSVGGLALWPGSNEVINTVFDARDAFNSGGVRFYSNSGTTTGQVTKASNLYVSANVATFGKVSGLGDIETLCNPAPIQIGNRVWSDTDNDGVQDPGEPTLAGVAVVLKGPGLPPAGTTVTTGTNGEYYFSSATGTNATGFVYSLTGLTVGGSYSLCFPLTSTTLTLSSKANSAPGTNSDNIDTDPNNAGVISFTLGDAGENNFSYDAGYVFLPCLLTATATPTACNTASNQYTVNGIISLTNTAGGTATIIDGARSTTLAVPANATSVAYSLTGLTSGTGSHTITVSLASCGSAVVTYSAPASCTMAPPSLTVVVAAPICNTATNQYTATGTVSLSNSPAGTITITDNGVTIATVSVTVNQPSIPFSVSGLSNAASHTVTATLTSGGSASATTTYLAPVGCAGLVVTSATVCAGGTVSLSASGCSQNVTWSAGGTPNGNLLSVSTTASSPALLSFTATCAASGLSASGTVTVNPAVTATIGGALSICAGQSTTLTASGAAGVPGSTYRWSTNATTPSISVSVAGTYSVTATSLAGCSNTATATVVVNQPPSVSVTSATICAGQSTTLTASGASTYRWNTGAQTPSITVSLTATTPYSVTGTSAAGCSNTATGTVTVNGQPQINSITQSPVCVGNTASLTVNATNTGAGTLEYSLNGGAFQTTNSFTLSAASSVTAVIIVRTQGSSCSATQSVVVNCAYQTPVSLVFVPTTLQTCAGSPVSFTVGVAGASSASLTSSGTGTFSQNVISGQQTVSYQPSLADATAGSVTLTLTSADPDGVGACVADQVSRVLLINPTPVVVPSVSVCAGEAGELMASGASTYRWSTGATTQSISVSVAGAYSVTGISAQGCSATASGMLTVYPPLTLSPPSLPTGVVGVAYSQTITASGGTPGYTFSSIGSLPNGLSLNTATGVISGTPTSAAPASFTVKVTDSKSCTAALPYTIGVVTASLGDFVFEDVNKDGVQDAGDLPISGAVVTLLQNGSAVATTTTSVSGLYSFTGLTPGIPYSVSFTTPAGFSVSTSANVGSDDALDNDAIDGLTGSYTLIPGENNQTIDAGFIQPTPRLILAKLVSLSKAKLGEVISYTVLLGNTGPVTATSVVVNDTYSAGLNIIPGSVSVSTGSFTPGLQGGTWAIASLPVGATATLIYSASITAEGVIYNTATIPGTEVQVCTTVPFSVCKGQPFSIELSAPSGYNRYQWYYTAPNSTSATLLADGTLNSFTATMAGEYQVTVDEGLGGPCVQLACCPILIEETEVPSYTALVKNPTCVGTTPQANGEIKLMNLGVAPTAYVYQVSAGSSFTASTAVPAQPVPVPANGLVATGLPNGTYTVRVWVLIDGEPSCPRDVTVTLAANCACPEDICVPVIIRKTKLTLR